MVGSHHRRIPPGALLPTAASSSLGCISMWGLSSSVLEKENTDRDISVTDSNTFKTLETLETCTSLAGDFLFLLTSVLIR